MTKTTTVARKAVLAVGLFCGLSQPAYSFDDSTERTKPEVMFLGTFHFENPGLDVIKTDQIDPMSPESQAYLEELTARIVKEYKPTRIMLEYQVKNEEAYQARYKDYLAGEYELAANENYQLGFRIAKATGGIPIQAYDDRSTGWDAEALFKVMPTVAPKIQEKVDQMIEDYTKIREHQHKTMTLQQLMQLHNEEAEDIENKSFYIRTNQVATEGNYEGSIATASWWARNFRMYAIIQRAAKPGERILVVGGQGHTAILKDFLKMDPDIKGVDIYPLL